MPIALARSRRGAACPASTRPISTSAALSADWIPRRSFCRRPKVLGFGRITEADSFLDGFFFAVGPNYAPVRYPSKPRKVRKRLQPQTSVVYPIMWSRETAALGFERRADCKTARPSRPQLCRPKISAMRSPIRTQVAIVATLAIRGMTEASATRKPRTPLTFRLASTTAFLSLPIRQVPASWK